MASVYIYILKNIKIFLRFLSVYISLSLYLSLIFISSSLLPLLFLFKITQQPRPLEYIIRLLTNSRLSVIFSKIGNWSDTLKGAANFGKGNGFVE